MKKIGVISDVHGNLQALTAALQNLKSQNCEEIIHTGDVVSIGGQSAECLELFLQNNVICLMGNHDRDFVLNVAEHKNLSHVSEEHKKYVFETMEKYRETVKNFPLFVKRVLGGKKVVFEHYCRTGNSDGQLFKLIAKPTAENFDEMYKEYDCDAVFFGHKHEPCDIWGDKLYVDVGSVGCHPQPLACGLIICYDAAHFDYDRFAVPYNQDETRKMMLRVPDGEYLFDFYYLHKNPPRSW